MKENYIDSANVSQEFAIGGVRNVDEMFRGDKTKWKISLFFRSYF